jgi:hypothetical protein
MATQPEQGAAASHPFIRPGQVAPDRPAPDACMQCGEPFAEHALAAVLEALDIPHAATMGDEEVRDAILMMRVMHAVVFLQGVARDRAAGLPPEYSLNWLRDKLAEHPAVGYRTWDEAVAERHARETGQEAGQ